MAGIVSGSIELAGLAQRLAQTPTPIKYLWIQTPIENKDVVFIGSWNEGESLAHIWNSDSVPPSPAIPPGVDKSLFLGMILKKHREISVRFLLLVRTPVMLLLT